MLSGMYAKIVNRKLSEVQIGVYSNNLQNTSNHDDMSLLSKAYYQSHEWVRYNVLKIHTPIEVQDLREVPSHLSLWPD